MTIQQGLPSGTHIFERGWLSSNNILLVGRDSSALIDSGYCSHASQTVSLVEHALDGRVLDLLVNTHLHSDHCGGNAALQTRYAGLHTQIPPGMAAHVRTWDPYALTYAPTGQNCPAFQFDTLLLPGTDVVLGDLKWQVHAAAGHDPHSVILFEPRSRVLVSADALWENGFGVVFPELEGTNAFDEVAATLDLIESLQPSLVIPGHGKVFSHVALSLAAARTRLESFVASPLKHAKYAAKVLLKFKLLELQRIEYLALVGWACSTPYFAMVRQKHFPDIELDAWVGQLTNDLIRSGAAVREGSAIANR